MKTSLIALVVALAGCSAAPPPAAGVATSVASPNAAFGSYRTFSFGPADPPKPEYAVSEHSLEVQSRVRSLVLKALVERGYTETPEKGDFVVKLASGTGKAPNPSAEHAASIPSEGYIGIDVYDGSTGTMVWQGSAFAEIDLAKVNDVLLQAGVDHMLASLPPGHHLTTASAQ